MKLERYRTYTLWDEEGNPLDERPRSVFRVFDVLEWRDSIRAAVEAEREAEREEREQYTMWHIQVTRYGMKDPRSSPEDVNRAEQEAGDARKALDALLADGGA